MSSRGPRAFRLLASGVLVVAGASTCTLAHETGLVQVEGTFRKDGMFVVELLVDSEHLPATAAGGSAVEALLAQFESSTILRFDGRRADQGKAEVIPPPDGSSGVSRLRFTGRTPPAVSRFTFANDAIPGFFFLKLRTEGNETPVTGWVRGGATSEPFRLDGDVVPPTRWEVARLYLGLGYTHIIPKGLDHVLFVLGIFFLAASLRPVLWQITAFTLAHTLSLALATLGIVSLPSSVVEPLIALSIVCIALENVFTSRVNRWRPLVVFCFGLLHGLGFAGVLGEIGLPRAEFVTALLSFNLGVEGGQLTVILAAFLALGLPFRSRTWYRTRIAVPCSLAIAATGLWWSIERLAFA